MRVLVCGSRDYDDKKRLHYVLDDLWQQGTGSQIEIIEGEAPGADTLAREWAEANGITVHKFPADWQKYGKAAGPIRNKQMLDEGKPDLVIAFPKDGNLDATKGTKNMVEQATDRGIMVITVGD